MRIKPSESVIRIIETWIPHWEKEIKRARFKCKAWYRKLIGDLLKLTILIAATWIAYTIFLYYCQSLWSIYSCTLIGESFCNRVSPDLAKIFGKLTTITPHLLAWEYTANSLLVCLCVGLLVQFFVLRRLSYDAYGFINKILWGGFCVLCTAWMTWQDTEFSFRGNIFLYCIPVFFLFHSCFMFTANLIPEISIFATAVTQFKTLRREMLFRKSLDETSEQS